MGRRFVVTGTVLSAALLATTTVAAAAPVRGHQGSAVVAAAADDARVTGASNVTDLGERGWRVQTSASVTQSGARISTPGFSTAGWLRVANDGAGAPGTEISALLQNGVCPHVFYSDTMKKCFGQMTRRGPDTIKQFAVPWWYRTDFTAPPAGQDAKLVINGVIGAADVFVDGRQIATASTVTGAYDTYVYDITSLMVPGTNSLAIEMHPNDPTTMLTLSNLDWTQIPPDNNTGIEFPVQLETGGPLEIGNAHVDQRTASNLSSSALTISADVTNTTAIAQAGRVTATIRPPDGGAPITVSQSATVAARTTSTVTFDPAGYPRLVIVAPRVWWPYQMGAQPLYRLSTSVSQGSRTLNSTTETFGIRTVTSTLVGPGTAATGGVRRFAINGVPLVIRGGGWDPDLFLRYDPADTAQQIGLMKAMGVNTIRLEGHLMPENWYEQMDAAGILVNAGFQCCDSWGDPTIEGPIYQNAAQTIGSVLRNHPSVFSFQWSDNPPTADQERQVLAGFAAADYSGPFVSSAEYNSSPQLGVSGEREGPYDWVPPNYWYDTTHYPASDPTLTNAGGSWGYDSEESAGDTVPTQDSMNRFLSPTDQANLWRHYTDNQYHANYEGNGHTGYEFGTLYNLDQAMVHHYGRPTSLAQYVLEAQLQNYADTRAQFEAFIDHSTNSTQPSTGTIYWQMNKGWPTLLWSLYNNDYDQAGSFFGTQEANQRLHAIFTLDDHTVTIDNLSGQAHRDVTVEAKVYDTAGALLDDQTSAPTTLASQQVKNKVLTPRLPTASGTVYFVELLVRCGGTAVDRNVYWDSTTPDVVNWSASVGEPQATMTSYANLTALRSLPANHAISVRATTSRAAGPNGADRLVTVTITNTASTPTVGFFLRADIRRGTAAGTVLPGDSELTSSIWHDNDITLWPGETQTITATYRASDLRGATPVISLGGWNVPSRTAVATVARP